MKKKTVRRLEYLVHIVTASLLLLKGYMEISRHLFFPGFIIASLGLLTLVIINFWRPLQITPKQARIVCYYLESPALFIISYLLYLEGREFHYFVFLIAAMLYPVVGFISSKKFKQLKKAG